MSNALAIAAATATLRSLLIRGLGIPDVTVKPLDTARKGSSSDQVNLFLYQTAIDAAWRNQDMPRQIKAGEIGQPPLPLCLYYLVTAFGEGDDETKAQQLLGQAMSVLHDHPLLGADEIKQATGTNVAGSDLHEQIERVRITPQPLSLEDLSKLWAAFQTNYRLSAAYQASVVLIESARPPRAALPVLKRGEEDRGPTAQGSLIPPFPTIEGIDLPNRQDAAQIGDQLTIVGHHFVLEDGDPARVTVTVRLATIRLPRAISADIPAGQRSDTQIALTAPHQAGVFYPAGMYRVTVGVMPNGKPLEERVTSEVPLLVSPRIIQINGTDLPLPPAAPIDVARVNVVDGLGDATLTVACRPDVLAEQPVVLWLDDRAVAAEEYVGQTDTLTFVARRIAAGTYRLRLRVDGVDSLLIDRSDPAQLKFDESQRVTIS
jgi:hypothetical protein